MISGSIPALVTPFSADGSVDESAFQEYVEWQISEGSSALVVCGTTGEAATLTEEEHIGLVRACVTQTRGRVPVVAGAGSNDTRQALAALREVRNAGADAGLVVSPYYNRPSQDGLFEHFAVLANSCELPIILYNVPKRTGSDLQPDALARLVRKFPKTFVGIKDSSGDLSRVSQTRARLGPDFLQLTGSDETALAFLALGGMGCISVTANVAPRLSAALHAAYKAGDYAQALKLNDCLFALHEALFTDASPGPVKYALTRVRPGFRGNLRLPMTWPSEMSRGAVDAALTSAGLLGPQKASLTPPQHFS